MNQHSLFSIAFYKLKNIPLNFALDQELWQNRMVRAFNPGNREAETEQSL